MERARLLQVPRDLLIVVRQQLLDEITFIEQYPCQRDRLSITNESLLRVQQEHNTRSEFRLSDEHTNNTEVEALRTKIAFIDSLLKSDTMGGETSKPRAYS